LRTAAKPGGDRWRAPDPSRWRNSDEGAHAMSLSGEIPVSLQALPARYYTDPALYALALDRIFRRSWQYVCHVSQLSKPGDYLATEMLGEDLFVVRGRDGALRCFYNVCQHRAHSLVEGKGNTRVLVCPYHAWTYELDGRLRAAPGSQETPGFDRSKICLTEVRLETFLGFVFVNFDPEAKSMSETYPGVAEAVRTHCPDIEDRVVAHEHTAHEFCNWLVAVENYSECYHCGHCHKAFAQGVIDPASYDIQPFGEGRVLCHTAGAAAGASKWYDTAGPAYASFYLYPAFSLQMYPGGVVNTYYWRPTAVDDTIVHRGWFSRDGTVSAELQKVIDLDRETTFAEDLAIVRRVQRGLGSRGYRPGPLIVAPSGCGIASEHSIASLHEWVREDIG
jgi:phenylpropionate dioxygenase-like ring-hydroxylating dioxygenase large terminal subunit